MVKYSFLAFLLLAPSVTEAGDCPICVNSSLKVIVDGIPRTCAWVAKKPEKRCREKSLLIAERLANVRAYVHTIVLILRKNGSRKTIIRSGSVDGLERLTHRKGVQLKE